MMKPKILMVIPYLGFGGAQKVFCNLSKELSRNYKIIECGFNEKDGYAYPSGNELIYLNVHGSTSYSGKLLNFIMRCIRLRRIKRKLQPIVTISHLEGADYINVLSGNTGKRVLCVHGTKNHDGKIRGILGIFRKKLFIPFLYNRADKIVTVSTEIKRELCKDYNLEQTKIEVIYNWFNQSEINSLANEPIEDEHRSLFDRKCIILSGRFDIQKNFVLFLKVVKEVLSNTNCRFIFLGDGTLRNEMIANARKLELSYFSEWGSNVPFRDASVIFLGYRSNPYKFLKNAHLFVLPSNWEGFPLALGEAMCCGLPVISSDCPTGPSEMLAKVNGLPVSESPLYAKYGVLMPLLKDDSSSVALWSKEILLFINNDELLKKYSEASKQRMNCYDKDKIIEQWENLIKGLSS